jgi:hypothetical protein
MTWAKPSRYATQVAGSASEEIFLSVARARESVTEDLSRTVTAVCDALDRGARLPLSCAERARLSAAGHKQKHFSSLTTPAGPTHRPPAAVGHGWPQRLPYRLRHRLQPLKQCG